MRTSLHTVGDFRSAIGCGVQQSLPAGIYVLHSIGVAPVTLATYDGVLAKLFAYFLSLKE